jgi:hypothetical protein
MRVHPTRPWVYVSIESQNKLYVYSRDPATGLSREPLFVKDTLFAEISAVRNLVERDFVAYDALESQVDPVEIHRRPLSDHAEQACRIAAQDRHLFLVAQGRGRKDVIHGMFLPWNRVVAAQHDLAGSHLCHEVAEPLRREHQGVEKQQL